MLLKLSSFTAFSSYDPYPTIYAQTILPVTRRRLFRITHLRGTWDNAGDYQWKLQKPNIVEQDSVNTCVLDQFEILCNNQRINRCIEIEKHRERNQAPTSEFHIWCLDTDAAHLLSRRNRCFAGSLFFYVIRSSFKPSFCTLGRGGSACTLCKFKN